MNKREYCEDCGGVLALDGVCDECLLTDPNRSEEYLDGVELPGEYNDDKEDEV